MKQLSLMRGLERLIGICYGMMAMESFSLTKVTFFHDESHISILVHKLILKAVDGLVGIMPSMPDRRSAPATLGVRDPDVIQAQGLDVTEIADERTGENGDDALGSNTHEKSVPKKRTACRKVRDTATAADPESRPTSCPPKW